MQNFNQISPEAIKQALSKTMFSSKNQDIADRKYKTFQTFAAMLLTDLDEMDIPRSTKNQICNFIELWKFADTVRDEAKSGIDVNDQVKTTTGKDLINLQGESPDLIAKAVFDLLFKPVPIPAMYWDRYQFLIDLWMFLDQLENPTE